MVAHVVPAAAELGHVRPEAAWCASANTRQPFGSRAEAAFRSALASRRRLPLASVAASPAAPHASAYIQVALAGLMMRSLQMATRLRHAFDPSAGYAAGATLVQHGHTVAHCGHTVARARSMVTRPCIHAAL